MRRCEVTVNVASSTIVNGLLVTTLVLIIRLFELCNAFADDTIK